MVREPRLRIADAWNFALQQILPSLLCIPAGRTEPASVSGLARIHASRHGRPLLFLSPGKDITIMRDGNKVFAVVVALAAIGIAGVSLSRRIVHDDIWRGSYSKRNKAIPPNYRSGLELHRRGSRFGEQRLA